MIHWRETDTGYILSVTRRGTAAIWGTAGMVPSYILYEAGKSLGPGLLDMVPFASWVLGGLGIAVYLACLAMAATLWRPTSWIEVAIQGRRARWGGGDGAQMPTFVSVERFESVDLLGPWSQHVVAALPDGRRVAVLPSWTAPPHRARRAVDRLNELLHADGPPA